MRYFVSVKEIKLNFFLKISTVWCLLTHEFLIFLKKILIYDCINKCSAIIFAPLSVYVCLKDLYRAIHKPFVVNNIHVYDLPLAH